MGCCFSKKRRKQLAGAAVFSRRCKPAEEEYRDPPPPLPEEEKVKEVLSETPVRAAEVKLAANVAVLEEPEVEKPAPEKPRADADAPTVSVSDLGSCMSLATDDRSEAASESSVATSSVAGPDRSPGKPARKSRLVSVSGELGHAHARRDRAASAYGIRSRSARASASPPPRREQRDRSVRRSPSPAAKRPSEQQRRSASPAASSLQRKPPVPVRPSPRRVQEAPPPAQPEEDAIMAADGEPGIADATGAGRDGEGKESLDNPLVSLECFIFL